MNKNAKLLNLIFSSESKKKTNNINVNNQDFIKKLSSTKQKISDINFSDVGLKNSNFIGFNSFKTKNDKSNNNSKIKQNKKNLITSLNDTGEKEENMNEEIILKYQYYKYLSNNNNSKEKNNLKKKSIQGAQMKNSNSNIKKNAILNNDYNKLNELEKKKIINKKMNNKKGEKNENNYPKNNRYKKINNNLENKIELFLSGQIKNNVISKEDLLSLFANNNISIKNKNINNKNVMNYTSTNPNNKKEKKFIASFQKNFEKSCPKFNFNKYSSYRQGQNNINIKKLNYDQINEDENDFNKKDKITEIKRIRANIVSSHAIIEQNNYPKNKKNLNLDNNKKNRIKSSKGNDYNHNIIEFFLPNKIKQTNIKEYNQGTLQKIILRNDIKEINSNQKVNTQTNLSNKKENKNTNKVIGVKKIRTVHEKTNMKKDLTLNNMALKKKRPRYFDSEINSNIIDSTNILQKFKNKNTYLNIIRKAFNSKNKTYYYNNYMSNDAHEMNSQRDSKSVNILRNKSNNNLNENNNKKKIYMNDHYINKLINVNDNKDNKKNIRHYSLNKNEEYHARKNSYENNAYKSKEINKDKIIENISNNSLNTFSIFISHKYYKEANKISLKKIKLFDFSDNEIPVIFYRTNADFNNGRLFNTTMTNLEINKENNLRDEIMKNNIPFLTGIKKDIYIYFYLNNNQSDNIKYIQIENYSNKMNKNISPVKNVEIYKGQNLIYKGILINYINTIEINNINKKYKAGAYNERPFSSSKTKKDVIIKNSVIVKPEFNTYTKNKMNSKEIYYSARNNLFNQFNRYANIKEEEDYSQNNENNNINVLKSSDNTNNKDANNTINIHINNNTNNITNLEIFEKNTKPEKKNTNNNNSYYLTMQNFDKVNNNENELVKSLNQNMNMSFGRINSETSNNYNEVDTKINENTLNNTNKIKQEIKEFDYFGNNDYNENTYNGNLLMNSINNSFNNIDLYSININNNNYIQFNKIKFVLTSNYGHKKHIGLTGLEFYNMKGDLINVESALSIGALPKDLRTVYDDESDMRIFENVFNGFNNTDEIENMWVTKLKKTNPKSFIELYFKEKIKVSKLKFYNYNEKNNLEIGVKTLDLYLDDNYYNTIYLKPGIGEIAYDYINLNDEISNDSEDGFNTKENDFGQLITFPIQNQEKPEMLINDNNQEIKYASFLYEQNYETPFMPCGNYIKFEFLSNYYKGIPIKDEEELFKYKDIGLDSIEIYNEENKDIISKKSGYKYKIISNCEIFHNKKNKLILNGAQNKNGNNCLFYIFETPINISCIKFNPLTKNMKSILNTVKEIKIFCDTKIIFEGDLYIEHPTMVLFTCDKKITKGINEKFLTKKVNMREVEEVMNNKYFSLILN